MSNCLPAMRCRVVICSRQTPLINFAYHPMRSSTLGPSGTSTASRHRRCRTFRYSAAVRHLPRLAVFLHNMQQLYSSKKLLAEILSKMQHSKLLRRHFGKNSAKYATIGLTATSLTGGLCILSNNPQSCTQPKQALSPQYNRLRDLRLVEGKLVLNFAPAGRCNRKSQPTLLFQYLRSSYFRGGSGPRY